MVLSSFIINIEIVIWYEILFPGILVDFMLLNTCGTIIRIWTGLAKSGELISEITFQTMYTKLNRS